MPSFTRISTLTILLILILNQLSHSQTPSDSVNRKRLKTVILTSTVAYTATMIGLSNVWYSNFDRQSFRFFDDSKEWKQVDKIGHFYAAFQLSDVSARTLQWAGLSKTKSSNLGALTSLVLMSAIEVFDGYSAGYGASASDVAANALGASFFLGQQLFWKEIRLQPKFSFHQTYLSNARPNVLGQNLSEELLKDYNGQTYWVSVDMDKFIAFPKWLNWAIGYGAHDFIFANESQNLANGYTPYRQFYLGLDIDLTAIKTESKTIKTLLYFLNMVKLPAPTLEFSNGKIKSHAFYF